MNARSATYISSEQKVKSLQRKLYRAAKKNGSRRFGLLYGKVSSFDVLQEAWRKVARNAGCSGVDGMTIQQVKEEGVVGFLLDIQKELESEAYRASAGQHQPRTSLKFTDFT